MANHHEVEVDTSVKAMHDPPDQVEEHVPVLILARTVIAVESDESSPRPSVMKKLMTASLPFDVSVPSSILNKK